MDGKLVGEVLGYFSHPDERVGKVFVFPHLFAEIMQCYMQVYGISETALAQIAVNEYQNAKHNPWAQMNKVQITLEQAMKIEGINRYVVEGLPLKTYDCSQITDGYAALILATEEGLQKLNVAKSDCVQIAGYAQATDPLQKEGRNTLCPTGAYIAMKKAYDMAGLKPADVNVAEIHDCFTVAAAIGTEVIGKAIPGKGANFWVEGKAAVDGECAINMSGGLIAKGHPVGATGIAMLGSCFWQLTGRAPKEVQRKDPGELRRRSISEGHFARRFVPYCAIRLSKRAKFALPRPRGIAPLRTGRGGERGSTTPVRLRLTSLRVSLLERTPRE